MENSNLMKLILLRSVDGGGTDKDDARSQRVFENEVVMKLYLMPLSWVKE